MTWAAYHSIQVPNDAPFRLGVSPGKGWGVFATRKILKGEKILQEKPLFVIRKPHRMIEERDVFAAYCALSKKEKAQFLSVRDNGDGIFPTMERAFAENSFTIPAQPGMAHGFFLLHSRFNHSCLPNCKIPDDAQPDDSITSYATCDIKAGAEILFCYETDFDYRTRDDRHRILRFECVCRACDRTSDFHVLSEMRRILMRGLDYLNTGHDIDDSLHGSRTRPIIADAGLRKVAETHSISLSSRFIYNLLMMALCEQEGLLDEFVEKRMLPGIVQLAQLFRTESNREMAMKALKQDKWTERFVVSSYMWGSRDAADIAFAQHYRLLASRSKK